MGLPAARRVEREHRLEHAPVARPEAARRRARVALSAAPTLVLVSGPPRTGKTRLAHALAEAIGCPAICRDEIKEGMVHAHEGEFEPAAGDPLTQRTFDVFFDVVRTLLVARVTVVAEAAFQDARWRMGLEPVTDVARLRVVQCHADPAVGRERRRAAHEAGAGRAHARLIGDEPGDWERAYASFERLSLDVPSLDVDTTDGYRPGVDEIAAFVSRPA